MKTSKLTENVIRQWVGNRSFKRGKDYDQQGAIMSPWLQDDTLKAQCWGTMPQPYRLWVRLGDEGIEDEDCSCSVGDGGYCNHVAALLLTWLHASEQFQIIFRFG